MFLIDITPPKNDVHDPILNQSIDNYLINNSKFHGHGLICYINRPSVIIGSAQNAFAEVDLNYLAKNDVSLVRRTSGGGAVYHDEGNIIFENIISGTQEHFGDYDYFACPILTALADMGLTNAEINAKSALIANEHKFSGMCMIKGKDGYAAGGTLMFDLNIQNARKALTPKKRNQVKRGVLSTDRSITNLAPLMPMRIANMSTEQFKNELLKHLFHVKHLADIPTYHLTETDWKNIYDLVHKKYGRNVWNYGKNPDFEYYANLSYSSSSMHINFSLQGNKLSQVKVFGTNITADAAEVLEKALLGVTLDAKPLQELLSETFLNTSPGLLNKVINALMSAENTHQILG